MIYRADDRTVHTQRIEGTWFRIKRWLPSSGRYNPKVPKLNIIKIEFKGISRKIICPYFFGNLIVISDLFQPSGS